MKKVDLPFIYQLGAEMHELLRLEHKARFDILRACVRVKPSVERLLNEYPALTVSRKPGKDVLFAIKQIWEWYEGMKAKEKPDWGVADSRVDFEFQEVIKQTKNFETILNADLQENLVAYHPQQKAIYSTALLIAHAESALHPQDLRKLEQKTIQEIREGGKCLAFDTYTASGFHMMRALELVLHEYYVIVCRPQNANKRLSNWAAYLSPLYKRLDDKCDTLSKEEKAHVKKVYYLLQQIKDLDRNGIMHPETVLSEVEALKLFDVAKTAMMVMAEKLPDKHKSKQQWHEGLSELSCT